MIETIRLTLRRLDPLLDNFENYLSWMTDLDSNLYIESVNKNTTALDLCNYVNSKNSSDNTLLLGIFLRSSNNHVGNIKFEPLGTGYEPTWMGILIGETDMRGQGIGFEALSASIEFLRRINGSRVFRLGVHKENFPAISLYQKFGFEKEINCGSESEQTFTMTLVLP